MLCDIIKAEYIEGYKLRIFFENGNSGIVDFSHYTAKGGVFSNFKICHILRISLFPKNLALLSGTVMWISHLKHYMRNANPKLLQ
jgi:hypothetical protein